MNQSDEFIIHDNSKCIKCGRCIKVCAKEVGASALSLLRRGIETIVSVGVNRELGKSACISCGECIDSCPTGALTENLDKDIIWADIKEEIRECSGCVLKCNTKAGFENSKMVRVRFYDTPLCTVGRKDWVDNFKKSERNIFINPELIADAKTIFQKTDYVLLLGYNPSGDNPRVYYELKKLYEKDIAIDTIFDTDEEIFDILENSKNPLVLFNYRDFPEKTYSAIVKLLKSKREFLLPVYYR